MRGIGYIIFIFALWMGGFTYLLPPALAQERTGEVLKELVQSVEKDVKEMEEKMQGYGEESRLLLSELNEKYQASQKEKDPVRLEDLRTDILLLNAKLNQLDRQGVGTYLETMANLRPKLSRLKAELERGGAIRLPEELKAYQLKLGTLTTNAANHLHKLKPTADPATLRDIAVLESLLLAATDRWRSPALSPQAEADRIEKAIKEIDEAYAHFHIVRDLLEQERQILTLENYAAIVRLTLLRLSGGNLDVSSIPSAAADMRGKAMARMEMMRELRPPSSSAFREGEASAPYHSSQDEAALEQMRKGIHPWNER